MASEHRRVHAAAVTGVGQLLGLLGSTLIGVLVAGTLPPSARVDAFFAANQVYALGLYLGQAVRNTAPALLVRAGVAPPRLRSAAAWMAVATVAFMVAVAVLGAGLVPQAARGDFTRDLLILAPAAGLYVAAGELAARLAVAGSFGWSANAYAAGSLASAGLLLVFVDGSGAGSLAPCIAAGAVAMAAVMAVGYARVPAARALAAARPGAGGVDRAQAPAAAPELAAPSAGFAARRIGLGAVPALAAQLLVTVMIVAAGHIEPGGTALLSYAFLALFAFAAIAITPMSVVLAPEVAERWDGAAASLAQIVERATDLAVVLLMPLVAVGFLVGRPLAGLVLPALSDPELDEVFTLLAVLCPPLVLTAAATAATVGVTAADRLGRLAAGLGAACVAASASAAVLAVAGTSLVVVAVSASAFSVVFAAVTLQVAVGREAAPTTARVVARNLPVIAPVALATALLAPQLTTDLGLGTLAACSALALHGAVVVALRRDTVEMLRGAARRRPVA